MNSKEIEKVLKWYCRDCECNDRCEADHKCYFHEQFSKYLKGDSKALPPEGIFSEMRFRRFANQMMWNLEKIIEDKENAPRPIREDEMYQAIVKGMKLMAEEVKKELNLLLKDE